MTTPDNEPSIEELLNTVSSGTYFDDIERSMEAASQELDDYVQDVVTQRAFRGELDLMPKKLRDYRARAREFAATISSVYAKTQGMSDSQRRAYLADPARADLKSDYEDAEWGFGELHRRISILQQEVDELQQKIADLKHL